MSDHPTDFKGDVREAIATAIKNRLSDAQVTVSGGGGHWSIEVTSSEFAGKSLLDNQRTVLAAIKHLINGPNPPVHAVDSLVTKTP